MKLHYKHNVCTTLATAYAAHFIRWIPRKHEKVFANGREQYALNAVNQMFAVKSVFT